MSKHKSNKIKENSNTVRHLIMGQIITTQNLVAIKEVRHAGQWLIIYEVLCHSFEGNFPRHMLKVSLNVMYLKITHCKLQPHLRHDDVIKLKHFCSTGHLCGNSPVTDESSPTPTSPPPPTPTPTHPPPTPNPPTPNHQPTHPQPSTHQPTNPQPPTPTPTQSQWRGALMLSLICARINGWVNRVVRLVIWDAIALIMTPLWWRARRMKG